MAVHTFDYKLTGYSKSGIPAYHPVIEVTLKNNGKTLKYAVLIDSGADFNIFHADIAPLLDINMADLKEPIEFGGVKKGSKCIGYLAGIQIEIDGETYNVPAVFTSDMSVNGYAIVGQRGFFDHFKIEFDYHNKKITLTSR